MDRPEFSEPIPLLISSERVREMQLQVLQGFIRVNVMNRIVNRGLNNSVEQHGSSIGGAGQNYHKI